MQTNLKINSNFFERILQLIKYYNIENVNAFAIEHLGYKASEKINRLKKAGNKPSFDIITDISNKFESIDLNWLITGNGQMLKEEKKENVVEEKTPDYGEINNLKEKLNFNDEQLGILDEYIELKIKEVLKSVELKVK